MEDLDAELLAVTDGKKRPERKPSPSDSDGAEFEGIADSDGGDDDDAALDQDDDDDDDNEYGVDDDDEDDYISKSKSKRKSSRSTERRRTIKPRSSKRRSKSSDKKIIRHKPSGPSDEEVDVDDDDEFQFKYDEQGYGDAADREALLKMNEFERELELESRIEARTREYDIWKKKREIMAREASNKTDTGKRTGRSSGRSKQSSKSDALQALAEDKRKKSSRVVDMDLSDADSEPDQVRRRENEKDLKKEADELKPDSDLMQEDGPDLRYMDLVNTNAPGGRITTFLFMRRDSLIHLSQEPYFERVVVGLFARVKAPGREDEYLLCRIASVKKGSVYKLAGDQKTNWLLVLQHGGPKRSFQIFLTSGSHPTEAEYERYRYVSNRDGLELPRRDEIERLTKQCKLAFERKITPTEEEEKSHIANIEVVYPHRVNWTLKRTEAKTALDIKRQDLRNARERNDEEAIEKLEPEVRDLENRLSKIRQFEEKYVLKSTVRNTDVFQSLAKRNMQLNSTNETWVSRQARQSGTAKANPFARVDTTGQSYFSIKSEKKLHDAKTPGNRRIQGNDWRRHLSVWNPDSKRRRISDKPVDPLYDAEISCSHFIDQAADTLLGSGRQKTSFVPPGASATNTIVTSDAKASINISEQKEKQPIDDITIDANNDDKGDQGFTTPPAGTIASSTFNICNNMIGTGCLAMPYAIKEIGLATGLMVIIFVAVGTQAALVMLAKSAHMMGNNRNASFHLAALKTYPSASALLDFAVVLKCFGTGVSYVVVAADLIPTIISGLVVDMDPESILLDRQFWVKMSVLVVTPLALLRRLDSLKYLSLLAVLAAVYLVAIVIGFAIAMPDGMPQGEWVKEVHWFRGDISTIIRISPVFVFAFNCHENVFSTSNELQDNTLVRMKKIINISVSFVFVLYLCVVVFGYLSIGDSLSSNIIQNYPTGPIVIGGKISIVILVLLSVPVQLHPLRVAVNDIVNTIITKVQLRRGVADSEVDHDMGTVRFATLTICLLLLKMVTASVITDLATILAYVGATGTTTISYILPGILFNKLSAVNGQKMNFERCVSLFLAGFGVSFMIVSVILQTIKLVG